MKCLDLSFQTPQQNLACDEALLDWSEEESATRGSCEEVLRFWESSRHFVTLGYTDSAATEADLEACHALDIPVLRRCSGGGTVLQGAGCFNYSLVLNITPDGPLSNLSDTNRFIMQRQRDAMESVLNAPVTIEGYTDLALRGLKFSGNAQRRKRRTLLFHGTLLLSFDLSLIERVLRMPSKQPQYRAARTHDEFITNIWASRDSIKAVLCKSWNAHAVLQNAPHQRIADLARDKYQSDGWNFKF
jgi:lipoate-protein ligase A